MPHLCGNGSSNPSRRATDPGDLALSSDRSKSAVAVGELDEREVGLLVAHRVGVHTLEELFEPYEAVSAA